MRSLHEIRLFLHTARYLQSGQVTARLGRRLRRACWKVVKRRAPRPAGPRLSMPAPLYVGLRDMNMGGPWEAQALACCLRAEGLSRHRFRFLNREAIFTSGIGWHDPGSSRLWRYHLHYFDYVDDLLVWSACGHAGHAYQAFKSIACSWMDHNDVIAGDGWHPYTISLRVVNWLHAIGGFEPQLTADPAFRARLLDSLRGQTWILSRDMEFDVRGNHLLANLRALIICGLASEGSDARRRISGPLLLLEREVAEQVLADGGHFERSPGYHAVVLKHCLEIALALKRNTGNTPPWLEDALRRMFHYLAAVLPPQGNLPLLKDTTWDAPAPDDLFAGGAVYLSEPCFKKSEGFALYPFLLFGDRGWQKFRNWPVNTAPEPPAELSSSRHYIVRDDSLGDHFIFDAGKPCPDYLPAHAHADLLTYELQVSGERIVVDSGVYEYTPGDWRGYFRSTRAHNTVEVSGTDQSEVWSSFRVAKRARPGKAVWLHRDGVTLIQGSHDGYERLSVPVVHRRTVLWKPDRFWLIVDELLGSGPATASSHIHLRPDLSLACLPDMQWEIQGSRRPLWIAAFGVQSHEVVRGRIDQVRQGWYSEKFGELTPNSVLTLHTDAALPSSFGYVIFKETPGTVNALSDAGAIQVVINQRDLESVLRVADDGTIEFK